MKIIHKASGGSQPRSEEGASHRARRGKNSVGVLELTVMGETAVRQTIGNLPETEKGTDIC